MRSGVAVAILGLVSALGCGGGGLPDLVSVRGEVFYKGEPLREGTVVYLPANAGTNRQATGPIQSDGSFVLSTHKKEDGVQKGEYLIAIYAYEPHPGEPMSREAHEAAAGKGKIVRGFIIPERYADPTTSGLTDLVDENHAGYIKLELAD